jgi:hypothetical protein
LTGSSRLGPGDASEVDMWKQLTKNTDLKHLRGRGLVTNLKALISEMRRVLDVHGERIRDEEREIALRGVREFSSVLESQVKSILILKAYVFLI